MYSQMWLRRSCAPHGDAVQRCLVEAYACRVTSRPTAQAHREGLGAPLCSLLALLLLPPAVTILSLAFLQFIVRASFYRLRT